MEGGVGDALPGDAEQEAAHLVGALQHAQRRLGPAPAVPHQPDVGSEGGQQAGQVALGRGGEEAFGEGAALRRVNVVAGPPLLDVLAGASGELAHRGLAALQHGGDLRVGVAERLPEHEHRPLQRGQRLQDDEDGQRDRVGEDGPLGGVRHGVPEVGGVRLGQPRPDVGLAARLDLAQPVDGEAGGDAHQVAPGFAHGGPVGAGPAQPGLLDHVLRVRQAAQHAVGDAQEDGPVLFEDVGRGVGGHRSIPADASGGVQAESPRSGTGATRR